MLEKKPNLQYVTIGYSVPSIFHIMEATQNLRPGLYRHLYWKQFATMAASMLTMIVENHMFEASGESLRCYWTKKNSAGMSEASFDFAAGVIPQRKKVDWSYRWNSKIHLIEVSCFYLKNHPCSYLVKKSLLFLLIKNY